MATLYILRHAHKEKGEFYNPRLRHADEPISWNGKRAAQKLVQYFADTQISAIYVSGYLRCRQTIEPVARRLHLAPIVDERLNEIDNGSLEGLSEAELRAAYPEVWKALQARQPDLRFPGGETGEEAQKRVVDFIEEKRKAHALENIIVVSHEGLIRTLLCHIVQLPVYKRGNFQVDPCAMMVIADQPEYGEWKLLGFNQTLA